MNCACTVKVNCAPPKDYITTKNKISHAVQHYLGQMKKLFWTGKSDHSACHGRFLTSPSGSSHH